MSYLQLQGCLNERGCGLGCGASCGLSGMAEDTKAWSDLAPMATAARATAVSLLTKINNAADFMGTVARPPTLDVMTGGSYFRNLPADVQNVLRGVASWKSSAEQALANYNRKVAEVAPWTVGKTPDPNTILGISLQDTRDAFTPPIAAAQALLSQWEYNERDAPSFTDVYKQELEKQFPKSPSGMSWKEVIMWAAGLYLAAHVVGAATSPRRS